MVDGSKHLLVPSATNEVASSKFRIGILDVLPAIRKFRLTVDFNATYSLRSSQRPGNTHLSSNLLL